MRALLRPRSAVFAESNLSLASERLLRSAARKHRLPMTVSRPDSLLVYTNAALLTVRRRVPIIAHIQPWVPSPGAMARRLPSMLPVSLQCQKEGLP